LLPFGRITKGIPRTGYAFLFFGDFKTEDILLKGVERKVKKYTRHLAAILALSAVMSVVLTTGCTNRQTQPRTQRYGGTGSPAPITPDARNYNVGNPPAGTGFTDRGIVQNTDQMRAQNTNFRSAQNVASALAGKHNIRRANVLLTDQTAFVAVDIPNTAQRQLTDQIKTSVADEVRRVDPSIQRVYVSADPDLFERFQGFSNDLQAGRPVQGIYDRFMELVQRVFPQQR
jgi:YhcN/YlaJ family sporulation lipoprotein